MGSKHTPEEKNPLLSAVLQFLYWHGPWVLLPVALAVGMFARQPPERTASSERQALDVEPESVRSSIRAVTLSAGEHYLDVLQRDATWRRHDAHTGDELWRRNVTSTPLTKFAISSADLFVAGRTQNERLLLTEETTILWMQDLPGQQPDEGIQSVAWSAAGNVAAAVSDRGGLWLLELSNLRLANIRRHTFDRPLDAVAWSGDGNRLAMVSADRGVLIWDVANSQLVGHLSPEQTNCHFAAWSIDGHRLMTFGEGKTVRVWNANTLALLQQLATNSPSVMAAALSPDGRLAAVGDADQIRIWDLDAETEIDSLIGHDAAVMFLTFDRSGTSLFSVDSHNCLIRWSLMDGRAIWKWPD